MNERGRIGRDVATVMATLAFLAFLGSLGTPHSSAASRGQFAVNCPLSHRSMDDPIVYPGQPGAAHPHDFFANRSTDAYSTYRSMRAAGTSCELKADTAGYWIPTLFVGGKKIAPKQFLAYYRTDQERPRSVRAFPKGLKIVAGDPHATSAQSLDVVYWDCEDGGSDASRAHPIDCGSGFVSASVIFPECWDGENLDTANHRSHMRYAIDPDDDGRDVCPKSHPIAVPRLNFSIEWPVHDGTKVSLSTGRPITLHGDLFNTWQQRMLRRLTARCLRGMQDCGVVSTHDRPA